MSNFRKGEEWQQYNKASNWVMVSVLLGFLFLLITLILSLPLGYIIDKGGLDRNTASDIGRYFSTIVQRPDKIFTLYGAWAKQFWNYKGSLVDAPSFLMLFVPWIIFLFTILIGIVSNPYEFITTLHGAGRLANDQDIKKMKLFDGFIIVLGKWKNKLLMLPETLSVLAVAPPGTGKTVGIVVPTILHSPKISLIVNDPKPELCFLTSGHRSKEGPVFIINWGAEDNPEKGIFYPSWNPLSSSCLPPPGPGRDMYIDSMVSVLVEEPKGGADPHWSKTGRNALSGLIHFVISKCERARANDYFISRIYEGKFDKDDARVLESYYLEMSDPSAALAMEHLRKGELTLDNYSPIGTWEMLPKEWVGYEPCIAMILDWMTESQMKIAADIKRRIDEGDQMAALADPMRNMLDQAVMEAKRFGYAHRAVIEMNQLSGTPDKERGSILSTALTGIGIFKNSAVRARTKITDLTFRDLRGIKDPVTGEMLPVTVYLSVNQVDAGALNLITGTFIELMSKFLISNPPNNMTPDGKVGPYPVLFVLDEFPQMPKLAAVKDGPAVGRGQKVSYLLIGQDLGQISGQYGKDDLETIITTTAAKVVLAQNNEITAKRFETMIGTRTVETTSWSKTEGVFVKGSSGKNVSRSWQGTAVLGASNFLSLPADEQVVIMQGFLNRPVLAKSPRWYLDPKMKKMCAPATPPAPNVPYWIVAQREDIDSNALARVLNLAIEEDNSDDVA